MVVVVVVTTFALLFPPPKWLNAIQYPCWLPHQLISLEDAIRCYTSQAAYACHRDNSHGSIRAGKMADIVLLDKVGGGGGGGHGKRGDGGGWRRK